jgi:hypothetical protein
MAQNKYLIEELKKKDVKIVNEKVKLDDILEKVLNIKAIDKYKEAHKTDKTFNIQCD